ncbi:zinc finger protein 510-like isoform X2 [Maniola jurtina]|uniref:zinc finger protein 510-like isoform X2 n=1 Tax=Maniola jurtina TaxID=191418 RepID=UPI001E688B36|nr:zinc finger protein 510-like isoform X2 [Maniola jurtina]
MNQNTLSKLAICRTCLDTEAIKPIFTEEMDAASYSGLVYTVTGIKVEMDDGLPQSICQKCVNNINNFLHFRKQCKEAETKLIIMKNKIENSDDIEINLKNDNMDTGIENLSSSKLEQSEFTLIVEKTQIKKEVNITVENNINDKHENFGNKKKCYNKVDQMKDLSNVDVHVQKDCNIEINRVGCKLCKKTIAKRKYHTHMTTKHKSNKDRTVMCNICNIYLNRKQINSHKLSHKKNKHIDNDIPLNNSTIINFNNDNLINDSFHLEIDKRQAENANESMLNTSTNKNTSNNNSENENFCNGPNDISVNNSIATDNENYYNDEKYNVNLKDKLIDSEVDINIAATENEHVWNDKQINNKLTNKSFTAEVKNCFTNIQKFENCFNDKRKVENCFKDKQKVEICFKDKQKVENCFNDKQKVENLINGEQIKTEMENILYNYNDTNSKRVTCKLCQKDLSIRSVDSHMTRSHPGVDKRKVKCDLCDNYVMKSKLARHKTLMHVLQGFICRYCKSEFVTKETLVEHVGSCTAKKKKRNCDASRELGECEVCHKTMQKGSLKLHHAVKHAGLRPVCENHERRHRGEKPFVCESCGSKFHASYLLSQHRQSHATDKAFQCDLCPASFKVNNTLHMHKRACHSTCKYACTMCTRTYSTRHYVVKHMRAMHRYTGPVPPLTPIEC